MIDTHSHIYFPEFEEEISNLLKRCKDAGVSDFILPNVDAQSLPQVKKLHSLYPEVMHMAIGLHPTEIKDDWENFLHIVEKELSTGNYVAVGEIGVDLYWDKTKIEEQKKAFAQQLQLAQKYNLPVIIHSRDAFEETMEVIEKTKPTVPLIFHSFTGDIADVERIRKGCDPYFGINGVVTYKNAPKLREALALIGIDKIILETDSPYLTPIPHRGKRNESSYLPFIRDKIAETLEIPPQEVERITDQTARKVFRL